MYVNGSRNRLTGGGPVNEYVNRSRNCTPASSAASPESFQAPFRESFTEQFRESFTYPCSGKLAAAAVEPSGR
jgi:hypothetical protein